MHVRKGWAAFLALVILFLLGSSSGLASNGPPVVGCFNPSNAALLARLGPADAGVRNAFAMGGCLALAADVPSAGSGQVGTMWRLHLFGSPVPFYVPDWQRSPGSPGIGAQSFAGFLPLSAQTMVAGRLFAYCDRADDDLARRWNDFRRRWDVYEAERGRSISPTNTVVRRHFTEKGPRLVHEADALQAERSKLERQCAPVRDITLDENFVRFASTLN